MILSLLNKDIKSELRQRYALNSLLMFVIISVTVFAFSVALEKISPQVTSGLLWVVMFFSGIISQSRSFVSEQERGTIFLLRLTLSSSEVYVNKLLSNVFLAVITNFVTSVLFIFFLPNVVIKSQLEFVIICIVLSVGFATAMTITAALISRSQAKGALYPVLVFPIILPQMLLGIDLIRRAISGIVFVELIEDIALVSVYIVALGILSWVLFDFIWKED